MDRDSILGRGQPKLQTLLEQAVEEGRIPSALVMLSLDGQATWLGTFGEMGPGVSMREDAIFPLASAGKIYTATAVMLLVEGGQLSLDDPVATHIPEFEAVAVQTEEGVKPPSTPITIHHLLTHTGGLQVEGDMFWDVWNAHSGKTTTTQFAKALAELPLRSNPGSEFAYGTTGASYEVLGAIVEIVSGQTLEGFMARRIFKPLGLEDTFFYLPAEKTVRLPAFFRSVEGELVLERPMGEDYPRSTFFHGGGGVQASAHDVARFCQVFLKGGSLGEVELLSSRAIETMMTDQVGDRLPMPGVGWGYGAAIRTGSGRFGWVGGGYAKVWVDPTLDMVGYVAFPLVPPGDPVLLEEFEQALYSPGN